MRKSSRRPGRSKPAATPKPEGFFLEDSRARTTLLALLLIVATVAVYVPVHTHHFGPDDLLYVNYILLHDGLKGAFSPAFFPAYLEQPLAWLLAGVSIQVFGLDPAGHHDESVALHALTVAVLFWVLKRATGHTGRSFMVAALVSLHPVNVESVAWIAARHTILSALFCYLALEAYRYYAVRPSVARYTAVAALFVLALMAKPQVIMLPVVLLLWDYWPLGRIFSESSALGASGKTVPGRRFWWLVAEKVPLFFICLLEAPLPLLARGAFGSSTSNAYQHCAFFVRLQYAIVSYLLYVRNAIWPSRLGYFYAHPPTAPHWWYVAGATLLLLVSTVLTALFRRHRYLVVGWLWFLIMLVPMLGIVDVATVQMMADRYAYVSFVGLFLMATWGFADWAAKRQFSRFVVPTLAAAILLAATAVTQRQITYWGDNVTLWLRSAEVTPGNWRAEFFAALLLDAQGKHQEAVQGYLRAAAINPEDPYINEQLLKNEYKRGNTPQARQYFERIVDWEVEYNPQTFTQFIPLNFEQFVKEHGIDRDDAQTVGKQNRKPDADRGVWQ